jgi:DNA polymerase-1
MIHCYNQMVKDDPEVNLVLQVHDSLVCECPLSRREEVEGRLVSIMEGAVSLDVPLKVEAKHGRSIADI